MYELDPTFRGDPPALAGLLAQFPGREFERGDVLVENTFRQPCRNRRPAFAYVVEGLVRGAWNRSVIAPSNRATAVVAGDGQWVGFDAFKFGENLFRYTAMTPTTASIVPLHYMREQASREVLARALESASLHWCTAASLVSLGCDTLERRALLLLYDLRRLHPRPEIEVRQRDLADLLGVVRQTLHPVLKRLEERGLVGLGYGEITIGDPAVLFAEMSRERTLRTPAPIVEAASRTAPRGPHGSRMTESA